MNDVLIFHFQILSFGKTVYRFGKLVQLLHSLYWGPSFAETARRVTVFIQCYNFTWTCVASNVLSTSE